MPQERENPYPFFTTEEYAKLKETTSREQLAARCVATQNFGLSIPKTAFMRGDNDHSGMMRSVLAFTTAVYKLTDAIDAANLNDKPNELPTAEEWAAILDANAEVLAMLEKPN